MNRLFYFIKNYDTLITNMYQLKRGLNMQYIDRLQIAELNHNNVDQIQELYEDFKEKFSTVYKFELPPLDYIDFKNVIQENMINGFILFDDLKPKAFLIYVFESHKTIELNLLYVDDNSVNPTQIRNELIKALINKFKERKDWNVISYPMLGIQETFVRDIVLQGFKLIGQAVVKFNFESIIDCNILNNLKLPDLPSGYKMTHWQDEYLDQVSQAIHDTFKTASDTKFDPRFLSFEGSKELVNKIVTSAFGYFLPYSTSILTYNDEVAGVCLANIASMDKANLPLIGIKKEHKNKGFGKYLLKNSVTQIFEDIKMRRLSVNEVNAAVETDNFPALRMYRRIGFKEDYTYTHAYLKNPHFAE